MIETKIPVDIRTYEEKIIFGLSIRQLVCMITAIATAVGSYFLFVKWLGFSLQVTSYIIMLEAIPLMAVGFLRKDGKPFEKYFCLIVRQYLGNRRLIYRTINGGTNEYYISTKSKGKSSSESIDSEYTEYAPSDATARRKRTKARIRAAREESEKAKQA